MNLLPPLSSPHSSSKSACLSNGFGEASNVRQIYGRLGAVPDSCFPSAKEMREGSWQSSYFARLRWRSIGRCDKWNVRDRAPLWQKLIVPLPCGRGQIVQKVQQIALDHCALAITFAAISDEAQQYQNLHNATGCSRLCCWHGHRGCSRLVVSVLKGS